LHKIDGIPIIERTVRSLIEAGIEEIVIVQSPRTLFADPERALLPSDIIPTDYLGCIVHFVEQTVAAGQGDAILSGADFIDRPFFVVQPENINAGDVVAELYKCAGEEDVVVMAGAERVDFHLYGVIECDGDRVKSIVEKPATASSARPLISMGVYYCTPDFITFLRSIEPDPFRIIKAIEVAAERQQARVMVSEHEFLPLKNPGHLWAYVRLLGLSDKPSELSTHGRVLTQRDSVIGPGYLDNVILGEQVVVGAGTKTTKPYGSDDLEATVVGPWATIGADVTLDSGVRIGAGATIRRGAHVTSDVPDWTVL
jgi:NDP-sugar pyrophosphorylase family protein